MSKLAGIGGQTIQLMTADGAESDCPKVGCATASAAEDVMEFQIANARMESRLKRQEYNWI